MHSNAGASIGASIDGGTSFGASTTMLADPPQKPWTQAWPVGHVSSPAHGDPVGGCGE
jgi:hypothetical protein